MLQWEHSAILSTFIKLPFVIKIFVLSIFEWPFYTGFTVFLFLKETYALGTFKLFAPWERVKQNKFANLDRRRHRQ